MRVGVIDYGVGNLGSLLRALEEVKVMPTLVSRATELRTADCLILPGVGNFTDCMRLLEDGGWVAALREEVLGYERPLLGICVGMQLLADNSTEGAAQAQHTAGLGLIPGKVRHLSDLGCIDRIPHVGWNSITSTFIGNHLFRGIPDETDFYFVHSYAFTPEDSANLMATTNCGVPVTAAVGHARVWGTQFHPEKSSRAGLRVLRNFIEGPAC